MLALALGIRQGEALGIKRERLDTKRRALRFPKQLQRQTWQHGCEDAEACAAPRTEPRPAGSRARGTSVPRAADRAQRTAQDMRATVRSAMAAAWSKFP